MGDRVVKDANTFMSSDNFKDMIDDYVKDIEQNEIIFRDIYFKDKLAISKKDYEYFFKVQYSNFKPQEKISHLIDKATLYVYENLSIEERSYIKKATIKANISSQMKVNFEVENRYKSLLKKYSFVSKYIKPLGLKSSVKDICNFIISRLKDSTLNYDDLIALTYLKLKLSGLKQDYTIKHLIIDEAQDYTLVQYEIIKNIFKDTEFTIVGDINQSINPNLKYQSFAPLHRIFSSLKVKHFSLMNCYRNSYEISNFANALIEQYNIKAMDRYTQLPFIYNNLSKEKIIELTVEQVNKMKEKGFGQIGIITKMASNAKFIYDSLKDKLQDIRLIDYNNEQYSEGVCVLSSYVSKGLEFDGVISINFEKDYSAQNEKHLLYVVFTRALHELYVLNEKETKLLQVIPKDLYKQKN